MIGFAIHLPAETKPFEEKLKKTEKVLSFVRPKVEREFDARARSFLVGFDRPLWLWRRTETTTAAPGQLDHFLQEWCLSGCSLPGCEFWYHAALCSMFTSSVRLAAPLTATYYPSCSLYMGAEVRFNFGPDFAHEPPPGHASLRTLEFEKVRVWSFLSLQRRS